MANSIVSENAQTGNPNSEWDLSGPGSTNIEGFAADISVNLGQEVYFKINTDCANYRIDIYRLGYYGGMGARKLATLQQNTASSQPPPSIDPAIGLVDAGNWHVSVSWAVPATAVSGVYIAKLVRQDGTAGENHIPFIVRDDGAKHDIVFQTSDTTWHAYNGWSGYSLYGGTVTTNRDGRAYKVSYNRPIATRDGVGLYAGSQDFIFGVEVAAIRWLEANGYDVCYISGVDTDRHGAELLNHKIFLSVGHDEYWSGGQRANVEAARAAGVNLAFWSGNEVFWKTRWESSAVTTDNTPAAYRTLVCYKETRSNSKIDPTPAWTGAWRDPSFSPPSDGGQPENALTGTIFQVDDFRDDVLLVPYPMTQLRFWRNTAVAATTPGQSASITKNLLGYEWDESPDNGFRPAGLIHLSATTLNVDTYLLDYGATDGPGTATHHLCLYRDGQSGALVFGAGTVFWAWGLDTNHDPEPKNPVSTPTDPNVQQAMVNLFADMRVFPTTLQPGLTPAVASTDTTPPTSMISAPVNGASLVQNQTISISGSATDAGGQVAGVEISTDGGTTWHPATEGTTSWLYNWAPPAPGSYTIKSRAIDDSLNLEVPSAGVSVTVTPAATINLFYPGDGPATIEVNDASLVELGLRFQSSVGGVATALRFYKNPPNTGTHVANLWSATGTLLASATFDNESPRGWQEANLPSPVTLTPGTAYVVSYHCNGYYAATPNYFRNDHTNGPLTALASAGNGVYASGSTSSFPTSTSPNADNYWVDVAFKPVSGQGNQPPVATNKSDFFTSENTALAVPASSLLATDTDPNGYSLSIDSVGDPTHGAVTYNPDTKTVLFTPSDSYTGPASFSYTITNGHGGTASALVSLTVTGPGTRSSLFGTSDTPTIASVNDATPVELGVKFQSSVPGSVVAIRLYRSPGNVQSHAANLWSATGTLLASASFGDESATGWREVNLPSPVALTPGTIYIASYHSNGSYSATPNYFATEHRNGPLTAPETGGSGGNGVYTYGPNSTFPTNTYNATNYWIDVVFVSGA